MWRDCSRMSREAVIRCEPGAYRLVARYGEDGDFSVQGESVEPITLTLRHSRLRSKPITGKPLMV